MAGETSASSIQPSFWYIFSFLCLLGGILVWTIDYHVRKSLEVELHEQLEKDISNSVAAIKQDTFDARDILDFFYATPPIPAIIRSAQNDGVDPIDNTPMHVWLNRLETIFESYMQNTGHLYMARVIRFDDKGSEMIRVEKVKGGIRVVENHQLQSKVQSGYFELAQSLKPDQVYISPINLNREWGQIQFPYQPTYRIAKSLFLDDGTPYGFIILNIDASGLLEKISNITTSDNTLYLLNNAGGAIIHPNFDLSFDFERNPDNSLNFDPKQNELSAYNLFYSNHQFEPSFLFLHKTIELAASYPDSNLHIIIGLKDKTYSDILLSRRASLYGVILGMAIIFIIGFYIYQSWVSRKLAYAYESAEFQAIVNDSYDAIVSVDGNGTIKSWNKSAQTMFGYTRSQALDKDFFSLLVPEDNTVFKWEMFSAIFNGDNPAAIEAALHNKDGTSLTTSITLSPITPHDDAKVTRVAAIIRDITDKKAIEKQILDMNLSLERQVSKRTKELEEARNEALEVSRVKSDFVASVSHEIRTPMNGVIGMLHLIEKEPLSEKQQHYLNMATNSASALTSLIDDILDLSKIESGKLEIDPIEINLASIIYEVCGSLAISANKKNLPLICDLSEIKHPLIISDDNRIRQILINLINNAIKFTQKGDILVSAQTRLMTSNEIEFRCAVKDTGVGIEKEKQKKLFQTFTQEDSSVSREYGGTGLGLAISKKISLLLGGDIEVKSDKGQGSQFTFHIKAPLATSATPPSAANDALSDHQIFIICQNDDLRNTLVNTIKNFGANIESSEEWVLSWEQEIRLRLSEGRNCRLLSVDKPDLDPSIMENNLFKFIQIETRPLTQNADNRSFICVPFTADEILLQITGGLAIPHDHAHSENNTELAALLSNYHSAKILLVDDNPINLEVGIGILDSYGLSCYTANSGQAALTELSKNKYDLVLLDCQMPEMDGYQVTRAIRKEIKNVTPSTVPIVAMTANAMSGAKEACLNAGMNDFLTKPLNPVELAEKVLFWLSLDGTLAPQASEPAHLQKPAPQVNTNSTSVVWNKTKLLERVRHKADRLAKLVNMYIEGAPERLERLNEAAKANQFTDVGKVAHEIKGVSGNIGGERLFELSAELEQKILAGNTQDLKGVLDQLNKAHHALLKELVEFEKKSHSAT